MNDIKFAIRQLLRSPGFTVVAVLTLALGIGANAAIVTMIQALVFKDIVAHNPKELAGIFQHQKADPGDFNFFSFADFVDLRADKSVWTDLAAFNMTQVGVREAGLIRNVSAMVVSPNYFSVIGIPPLLGRAFVADEEIKAANTVLLTHAYWQRIGGAPDIVGSVLRLAQGDFTVVGVMPEGFTGTDLDSPSLFFPSGSTHILWSRVGEPPPKVLTDRSERSFMLFARLQKNFDLEKANAGLKMVSERFRVADPKEPKGRELVATKLARFAFSNRPSRFAQKIAPLAAMALALSVSVLAVACLNLANMLLACGAARRKEIAVRLAIGASRARILRQLLCEGFILALLGSACGLLLALWSTSALAASLTASFGSSAPRFDLTPDGPTFAVLLALCSVATLFFALGPAWKLASLNVNDDLKQHGSADPRGRWGRFNIKSLLVVGQLALSLALLVGAALFTRSAVAAINVDPGFGFGGNFIVRLDAGLAKYLDSQARNFFNAAEEQIAALPGVESVSTAMFVPFGQESWSRGVQIGGAPKPSDSARNFAEGKTALARYNIVGADYFKTLGVPLLRGRDFTRAESTAKPPFPIAIISQDLAETIWPGEDPIGRTIQFSNGETNPMQIVGVAPKIMGDLFEKENSGAILVPRGQDFRSSLRLHVRVMPNADPDSIMSLVRKKLFEIDPNAPIVEFAMLKTLHKDGMSVRIVKIGAMLFGAFGLIAMLLSFLGVYGLKAYSVARRTREIGIRMALGATARDVVRMILDEGARTSAAGLVLGLALAVAVGNAAGKFLYNVNGLDPLTFAGVSIGLASVSLFACWLPARRAARVNPMAALRSE